MTFAAIPWLAISINLLLVIFFVVCVVMILIIMMQRPKQEGLGAAFGGGVTDQVFGARTTNVLQRGTVYLGSLFFLLSLTLASLIGYQNKKTSIVSPEAPAAEVKAIEPAATPEEAQPKSLLEELPATDVAPSTETAPVEIVPSVETPPAEVVPTEEGVPTPETAPANPEPAPAEEAAPPSSEAPPLDNAGQP